MSIYLALPAAIAIIGLILYLLPLAKASEIGRLMFFAGTLAICLGHWGDRTGIETRSAVNRR